MPALLLVAMVLAGSPAGAASSELEVLSGRFPLTLQFRGNPVAKDVMDVGEISRVLNVYSGRTDKFIDEEMRRDPRHAERFQRWKEANPGKLLLLHLNGEARAVWPAEVHERYFPGHWVYYPGAGLEAPIDATTTQIRVADARPFAARKFGNRDEDGASHRTDILLVEVDDAGRRQWHRSEYASITAVDAQSGILTLQRGRHGSTARTFAAGRTYVAPLVSGYWGGNVMWFYNLSSSCPTDRNGHTAADHFLDEIAHWFSTDGPLPTSGPAAQRARLGNCLTAYGWRTG